MRYLFLTTFLAAYLSSFCQLSVSITSSTNASCFGACDGSATATPTGGTLPYTYLWSTGDTNQTENSLCSGTYFVIVTDSLGATAMDSIIITEPPLLLASIININYPSCNGSCDGSATVSVSGGSGGVYTYSWSTVPMQMTPTVTGLCAGVYSVEVADSNGCSTSDTIFITEPAPLSISFTTTDDTCGLCTGSVTAMVTGGTPPYMYYWYPPGGGPWPAVVTGLCAGSYASTIVDSNGCTANDSTIVNLAPGPTCQYGYINGTVYNDINANCNQDTLEIGLSNVLLQANPGPYYATSNASGEYSFVIPFGNYTVTQVLQPYYNEICPVAGSYALVLDSINNTLINNDFADTISGVQDVSVSMSSTSPRPGFPFNYYINYSSISSVPINGTVSLVVDDTLNFSYASITPNLISGDTLFWNYTNLQQFETRYLSAVFQVPNQVGLLGDTLTACAQVTPIVGDVDSTNNTACNSRVITGSFDPNDKEVEPKGVGSTGDILLSQQELTYTVRFQNTGTAPAVNVVVVDTLSANLDVTTLKNVMASHPFTYEVSGQGILTFSFDSIMLPDSNINEAASHGLIQFTIDQNPANNIGTVIENTAEIYFDFNPAVITNTVVNTIVTVTDIYKNENSLNVVNVYPNPSNGLFTIDLKLEKENNIKVELFDVVGKKISGLSNQKLQTGSHQLKMDIAKMSLGIYFMSVQIGSENYLKKIVVQ